MSIGDLNRRAIVAGLAAAPAAGLPAVAGPSDLDRLIEDHKVALAAFRAAIEAAEARGDDDDDIQLRLVEACDAEDAATLAVCAYPCVTIEEARRKAAYVATIPSIKDEADERCLAFIHSLAGMGVAS